MALYLVQHGVSAAGDIDPGKGLTERGREETALIAGVAQSYGISVAQIVHSGKKRAAETAAIFHRTLSLKTPLERLDGLQPLDDVKSFAQNNSPESGLMVIGHLPFLSRLVSLLTTGSEDIRVYRFQNSGIVCLDADDADGSLDWFIRWTLNPDIS